MTVFDSGDFVESLEDFQPQCPRCQVPKRFASIPGSGGDNFEYYRCPTRCWDTKCYVTCPADEVREYLMRRVERQIHPCYKKIDPARFHCECDLSLVLATSHSVNNPERLYLKCPRNTCMFFQWINQPPKGMARKFSLTEREYIKALQELS